MEFKPLVSVGVASFNNASYIGETLNSIARQTYSNFEIIINDDCSTDNSVAVIRQWIDVHQDISCKLIVQAVNRGISHAFNELVTNATGEFITTIGSDDNFLAKKIENFVGCFRQLSDDYAVVYSDAFLIKGDGSRRHGRFIQTYRQFEDVPTGNIYDDLLIGNFIPAMATMIRKSAIDAVGGIDTTISYEDYDLWLRLAKKYKFHYHHQESVEYRIHSNSITSRNPTFFVKSNLDIFAKHVSHPKAQEQLHTSILSNYQHGNKDVMSYVALLEQHGYKVREKFFFKHKINALAMNTYFRLLNMIN